MSVSSTINLMNVVWAWSPIGYETYLSIKKDNPNTYLITARNFSPPESISTIYPHNYFTNTHSQIDSNLFSIQKLLDLADDDTGFIFYAPQSASFYLRLLIESHKCKGYVIYDEGSAAYDPHFNVRLNSIWSQHTVRNEKSLINFCVINRIDKSKIDELYKKGTSFYDFTHPKFIELTSYFKSAFPAHHKIGLSITQPEIINHGDVCLILMPPLSSLRKNKQILLQYLLDCKQVLSNSPSTFFIVKGHPVDSNLVIDKVQKLFDLPNLMNYSEYCIINNLNHFRETAFMNFPIYITNDNSTKLYLEHLSQIF